MFLAEKKVRLLDEAADRIKSYIEDHQLQPGMRLPSERDLVKQLSLGRTSIREGLRYLEMLDLIEIQAIVRTPMDFNLLDGHNER
jgi:GntR family transcriptional regulator, transcriptional repressor for pyruvate dehydrogenase complex